MCYILLIEVDLIKICRFRQSCPSQEEEKFLARKILDLEMIKGKRQFLGPSVGRVGRWLLRVIEDSHQKAMVIEVSNQGSKRKKTVSLQGLKHVLACFLSFSH